jgi:hypothetical protein
MYASRPCNSFGLIGSPTVQSVLRGVGMCSAQIHQEGLSTIWWDWRFSLTSS